MTIVISGHKVEDDTKFEYVSNPKRPGFMAYDRYEEYCECQNLAQYLYIADPKYAKADLAYDSKMGHLQFVESED